MNIALLEKQAWRILTNYDSLVTDTLLPKYYNRVPFSEVRLKADDSWRCKSIWSGEQSNIIAETFMVDSGLINGLHCLNKITCPLTRTSQTMRASSPLKQRRGQTHPQEWTRQNYVETQFERRILCNFCLLDSV